MKTLLLLALLFSVGACASSDDKHSSRDKGLDVDKINCSWNKTSKEANEKCSEETPKEEKIATKLDKQLSKDAKTIKKFFGIKSSEDEKKEETAEKN